MRFIVGKYLGLVIFFFWIFFLGFYILVMPVNLFFQSTNVIPPDWLANLYKYDFFNWEWWSIITILVFTAITGGTFMWAGWQSMHPITVKSIKIDRRRIVQQTHYMKDELLRRLLEEKDN